MVRLISIAVVLVFMTGSNLSAQEGRLQTVRDEARADTDDNPRRGDNHKTERPAAVCDNDDDDDSGISGAIFVAALLAPFAIPKALLHDDSNNTLYFARHPYQAGLPGYMFSSDPADGAWRPPVCPTAVRVSLEDGNDFAGLNRVGAHILLETASRFGLQTSWNVFQEELSGGRTDQLVLGDVNLVYRFAQNEWATMRSGIGFRVLADHRSEFGFNFTYGGDFFPVRPLVLSTLVDVGDVGSAFLVHARGSVGAILGSWEIFTGYDFFRIGSVNLQGPMLGVRFWY